MKQTVHRDIVRDFMRGLSIVGLARKYGCTKLDIENSIRRYGNRRRR